MGYHQLPSAVTVIADYRLYFVRRSRLQWRIRPDKEQAAELLSEIERREIRWCETRALPANPDLSASPETWR